jgi:hypothetical protein
MDKVADPPLGNIASCNETTGIDSKSPPSFTIVHQNINHLNYVNRCGNYPRSVLYQSSS